MSRGGGTYGGRHRPALWSGTFRRGGVVAAWRMPCRTALPAKCHLDTLLSLPLLYLRICGPATAGREKRNLTSLEKVTVSADGGFGLTCVRSDAVLCMENGRMCQLWGRSAFFLIFRRKSCIGIKERKKQRKARLRTALRSVFSGIAAGRLRLCAQIRASLLIKKVFLPQRRPHLSAKKTAFLRKFS